MTYLKFREVRKEFFRINQLKFNFNHMEHLESVEIQKMLNKLRVSHSELCSKKHFMESQTYKDMKNSTQLSQAINFEPSVSQSISSTFEPNVREDKTQEHNDNEEVLTASAKKKTPVAADEKDEELLAEMVEKKIKLFKIWANQLRHVLTKKHLT